MKDYTEVKLYIYRLGYQVFCLKSLKVFSIDLVIVLFYEHS